MRLRTLTIEGFRGFNSGRTIPFHERLTLIAAPNSHGKTSITESLEYLLFGATSKVEHAESKDEYKDSYRNRHFDAGMPAVIEAVLTTETEADITLRAELSSEGIVRRSCDGNIVQDWPFVASLASAAKPFVIQHALKQLLLVEPVERFKGFARLLGLNDVDALQRSISSLCTKPEVALPDGAAKYLKSLTDLEDQVRTLPGLREIAKEFKRGSNGLEDLFRKVEARATAITGVPAHDALASLLVRRDDAAKLVYSGADQLGALVPSAETGLPSVRAGVVRTIGHEFIEAVARCAAYDALVRLQEQADFLKIGNRLLQDKPDECPFCGQAVEIALLSSHVHDRHTSLTEQIGTVSDGQRTRADVVKQIAVLRRDVRSHWAIIQAQTTQLVALLDSSNETKVRALLGTDHSPSADLLLRVARDVAASNADVQHHVDAVEVALASAESALEMKTEQTSDAEHIVRSIHAYLARTEAYLQALDERAVEVAGAAHLLQLAVDAKAGTEELSVLIRLLEKPIAFRRAVHLRDMLDSLKLLKKHVEQTVGEVMEAAFTTDLTDSVMHWYGMIRTTADPDVHFDGFSMERTKSGDYKNGRVRIGAKSYGSDLASAVSSLSESKLNALGLCVSIATAVDSPGPWQFIVLDDPIQSWDEDHEDKFIELVRVLATEKNKQVILLSHRDRWIDRVADGCRAIGGRRFQITGYDKLGPQITEMAWMPIDDRLKGILRTAKDLTTTPLQLQQAEEDVRIAVADVTADAAKRKLKRQRNASSLNRKDVRSLLTEMACPTALSDRVVASFGTTDDAHHVPDDYQPNRERLLGYHGMLCELKGWSESK